MDGKYLLLLINKLETFSGLFGQIKAGAPYKMDIATTEDLFSGKFKKSLDLYKPSEIVIAIDDGYFQSVEQDIRNYLDSVEKKPFTNFLYLFEDRSSSIDIVYAYKKPCYLLFHDGDQDHQIIFFNLFVLNLFDKAILSFRLSDYILHSFKEIVFGEILKKKTKELEVLKEELERRNKIDTLTGLFNRRALFEFLETERSRTIRYLQHLAGEPPALNADEAIEVSAKMKEELTNEIKAGNYGIFSIMMIDLDQFKKVNDTYGHLTGDKVLRALGQLFTREGILRKHDIVGRFGGEEFIVILPNTNANNALGPAIRLARELDKIDFTTNDNRTFKVTLSIGLSEYHPTDKNNEMIIHRADTAMYHAKQHGRNQIIIYEKIFN
jgi:diguanylate cyclase (GGDEF)-like protein